MHFLDDLDGVAPAHPEGCGRPFAYPIHGQDGGLLERGGEERAGGMRLMVLGVEDLSAVSQGIAQLLVQVQLVF